MKWLIHTYLYDIFMKILITGAYGFIGRNLVSELRNQGFSNLMEIDKDSSNEQFTNAIIGSDFIFHLAGVNRPERVEEFESGNSKLTNKIVEILINNGKKTPVLMSSSVQASLDNPYGKSKKAAEIILSDYGIKQNAPVYIFRLTNVFGKWSKPNYNSVVATFCHNIANGLPIQITDADRSLQLAYIDDVINAFINCLKSGVAAVNQDLTIKPVYDVTIAELAGSIRSFSESRKNLYVPDTSNEFIKKLYSTYLSYLHPRDFGYMLHSKCDERGSFTEFIRSKSAGQVSINITKPGITKGNHWHHTKNEKFLVIKGMASIRFRRIYNDDIIEYKVSDERFEVIDIPVGYTHQIENTGTSDLITLMWANEVFDQSNPDTYLLNV